MTVDKTYRIDPRYAGLVIGKAGKNLKALQQMAGVKKVYFDSKSSKLYHTLRVIGVNSDACEMVYYAVLKKIEKLRFIPEVGRIFIDINDRSWDTVELVPFGSERAEAVVPKRNGTKKLYSVSAFTTGDLYQYFNLDIRDSGNTKPYILEYSEDDISMAFEEALENHRGSSKETFEFHLSPGKLIFVSPKVQSKWQLLHNKITGLDSKEYLQRQNIRTTFAPQLDPKYVSVFSRKLAHLGFEDLHQNCPETFTTVHLYVGEEQIQFTALLMLDENLETPKNATDDPRLSEEKKEVIRKIMHAKTIGEVIGVSSMGKLKVTYMKLSLKVHPDKNLHKGATEAFKKLKDAYEKLHDGRSANTKALTVDSEMDKDPSTMPPKVVRVTTRKVRMCILTTMSERDLDLRASLVTYEEDKVNLSDHVKQALNMCWDQRDSSGEIPTPEGEQKITISCIKQIVEGHTWVKEIPYGSDGDQTAVVEVRVKRLRELAKEDSNWIDGVEIDLKLIRDEENLTSESLTWDMLELRKWLDKMIQ